MHTQFWFKRLKGRDHPKDMGADRTKHKKICFMKLEFEGVDWIHLSQNRDRWWAHVNNTVMKFQVTWVAGKRWFVD